jgi:FkbM family methyltransferase
VDVGRCSNTSVITGGRLLGDPSDFHFALTCARGFYDWGVVAVAAGVVPRGGSIVEVGANVGTESRSFLDLVGKGGEVRCFEPVASNFEWLSRNFAAEPGIEIHPFAISDHDGVVELAVSPRESSGMSFVAGAECDKLELSESWMSSMITAHRLDTLVGTASRPVDLLVADVEGHEVAVLRGASELIQRDRPSLILEVAPSHLARAGSSATELFALLKDVRYDTFAVRRGRLIPLDLGDFAPGAATGNVASFPSEQSRRLRRKAAASLLVFGLLPRVKGIVPTFVARSMRA